MNHVGERRLGMLLLQALRLACAQRDIDAARAIQQLLECRDRCPPPETGERRQQWTAQVGDVRRQLQALEGSLRRNR